MKNPKFILSLFLSVIFTVNFVEAQRPTQNKNILPAVSPVLASNFKSGKNRRIPTRNLKSEINFWLGQFKEHLIYLKQGLGDSKTNKDLSINVNDFKKELGKGSLTKRFFDNYKKFLNDIEKYSEEAVEKSKNNKVLHPLSKHILDETRYHKENVNGTKRTAAQESKFWAKHDNEVATLKAKKMVVNDEEKKLLTKLEQLGINQHENREDRYAKGRLAKK